MRYWFETSKLRLLECIGDNTKLEPCIENMETYIPLAVWFALDKMCYVVVLVVT